MYVVYILFSPSLNKYYVGSTLHLSIRLVEHNRGKSPFTKKGMPWTIVHQIECESHSVAVQLENKIKKRCIGRYLEDINIS
jgi:putative endonuclease